MLAGGRSVRFGGEKAVALLDGRPLLAWAAERLRTVCASVAINVRPGTEAEAVAKALGFRRFTMPRAMPWDRWPV